MIFNGAHRLDRRCKDAVMARWGGLAVGRADGPRAIAGRVRRREVTVCAVVEDHLDRLEAARRTIGGVAWLDTDRVLDGARAADEALTHAETHIGPLHGVPVTVKDWIDVEGFPCAGGDVRQRDRRPTDDATVAARLRAAGAIVVAKTAAGDRSDVYGVTRNPYDHARSPGASSSGEAALISAGASPLGIGSDSGGSIRLPAAWCGVAGFKPSAGRVPNTGHFPRIGALHDGRTQIGPLARNVDDLALALEVIAGFDGLDPGVIAMPLGSVGDIAAAGLRVAWFIDDDPGHAGDAVAQHVELAVAALGAAGATIVDAAVPAHLAEALDITERYWRRRLLTGPEADDLLRDWDRFRRRQLRFSETVDLVVSPATRDVASLEPPEGIDYVYTLPASLTGAPAATIPTGFDGSLPIGVQLVGRRWHDATVLAAARVIEAAAS
jgi:amidase